MFLSSRIQKYAPRSNQRGILFNVSRKKISAGYSVQRTLGSKHHVISQHQRIESLAETQQLTLARSGSAVDRQKCASEAVVSLARASCVARGAVVLGSPLRLKKSHGSLYPKAPRKDRLTLQASNIKLHINITHSLST